MKIAILLTGHLRTFLDCWPKWKKFIDHNNADLYLHIWDNIGIRLDHSFGAFTKIEIDQTKIDVEQLSSIGIKNIIIENYEEVEAREKIYQKIEPILNDFIAKGKGSPTVIQGWYSQYYKRLKGIEWIISQNNYDMVFLSRPDFLLEAFTKIPDGRVEESKKPTITELDLSKYDPEKLHATLLHSDDGYHDFYFWGSPELVKKTCEIWNEGLELHLAENINTTSKLACGHAF